MLVGDTARKSFVATLVAVAVVASAFALWQLRALVALLLLAVIIASAMRPGVEWLHERRIPRPIGVAIHYLGFLAAIGLLLWLIVPRALDQTEKAIGTIPTSAGDVADAAKHSHESSTRSCSVCSTGSSGCRAAAASFTRPSPMAAPPSRFSSRSSSRSRSPPTGSSRRSGPRKCSQALRMPASGSGWSRPGI